MEIAKIEYTDDELFNMISEKEIEKETNHLNKCNKCNSINIIKNTVDGTYVCTKCGLILEGTLVNSSCWSIDGSYDHSSNMNDILTNTVSYNNNYRGMMRTLYKWYSLTPEERSLNIVFNKIRDICKNGNIDKCIEDDAKIMYKYIDGHKYDGKKKILRAKNRSGTIAGVVMHACKRKGEPRSPKEIAKMAGLKYPAVTKGYKIFITLLNDIDKNKIFDINIFNTSEDFVKRFCHEINIDDNKMKQACIISNNIYKLGVVSDHVNSSIASASILLMAELNNINIPKKILENKFNISMVTISKTYKKIITLKMHDNIYLKDLIIDNNLTNKYIEICNNKSDIRDDFLENINNKTEKYIIQKTPKRSKYTKSGKYKKENQLVLKKLKYYLRTLKKINNEIMRDTKKMNKELHNVIKIYNDEGINMLMNQIIQ